MDGVNFERNLFETTILSSPGFPMGPNERLHLILTNPHELEIGLEEGWPLASEIVDAIRGGDYQVLQSDDVGQRLLAMLQAEARRRQAVHG